MRNILFSTPYWHYKLKDFKKRKNKFQKLLKKYPLKFEKTFNYSSNTKMSDEQKIEFTKILTNLLEPELNKFCSDVKRNIKITKSWGVSYSFSDDQMLHHHGANGFTAVLYLNYDIKNHEPTLYKVPWNNIFTGETEYTVCPNVEEGDFVIFPAFVEHFSPVNKSKKIKTIIGLDMS